MTSFEKLFAVRLLTGILAIAVITIGIIIYESYAPSIFNEVEHILAQSMGSYNSGIAVR